MYTPKKNKELCIQYTIIFVQKRKVRKNIFLCQVYYTGMKKLKWK